MPVPAALLFGLGLAGSAIGAGVSAHNASQTNKLNYKLFKEQQEFNREMWHMQNAYNTPQAQRQRLEQAGINPAIALGNITTGTAQAVQSASPAPAVGHDAGNILANGIQNGANSLLSSNQLSVQKSLADAQVNKTNAETAGILIDNKTLDARKQQELKESMARELVNQQQASNIQALTDRYKQLTPEELKKVRAEVDSIRANIDLSNVQRALADFNLKHLAPAQVRELQARIAHSFASVQLMAEQGALLKEQAIYVAEQALESEARRAGIEIDNKHKPALQNATLKTMASKLQLDAKDYNLKTWQGEQQKVSALFAPAREFFSLFPLN